MDQLDPRSRGGARSEPMSLVTVLSALARRGVVVLVVGVANGGRALLRHALLAKSFVLLGVLDRRTMRLTWHSPSLLLAVRRRRADSGEGRARVTLHRQITEREDAHDAAVVHHREPADGAAAEHPNRVDDGRVGLHRREVGSGDLSDGSRVRVEPG